MEMKAEIIALIALGTVLLPGCPMQGMGFSEGVSRLVEVNEKYGLDSETLFPATEKKIKAYQADVARLKEEFESQPDTADGKALKLLAGGLEELAAAQAEMLESREDAERLAECSGARHEKVMDSFREITEKAGSAEQKLGALLESHPSQAQLIKEYLENLETLSGAMKESFTEIRQQTESECRQGETG